VRGPPTGLRSGRRSGSGCRASGHSSATQTPKPHSRRRSAGPFDFAPFREAAALLYGGPWVAERYAAAETLMRDTPEALLPVTRAIIEGALGHGAVETFKATYRLEALRRGTAAILAGFDVMAVPTTGTIYTVAEVEADPIALNSNLGVYTNFVNFLDLSAIAVPNGFQANGLPLGITLIGPAFADVALARLAARWQRALDLPLGATGATLPAAPAAIVEPPIPGAIEIAVFGAHMKDLPLSAELERSGAIFRRAVRTAPCYRMYLLDQFRPPRPGLLQTSGEGARIAGEVWAMSPAAFGRFVDGIAAPLGIGTVALDDGSAVKGFLCEAAGAAGRRDITAYGGWRAFAAA
jgi:allophanate hydrolase